MASATSIPGVSGATFALGTQSWENNKYQYATSSHGLAHNMNPSLIISAASNDDIVKTLAFARDNNKKVAVRTGGHQYSGASSCGPDGVLLDLSRTFRADSDLRLLSEEEAKGKVEGKGNRLVFVSVSHALDEFNRWLGKNGVFVPHGESSSPRLDLSRS